MSGRHDVIVVGAGLAGLRCAVELRARGLEPLVLEAADAVGGRVRTDEIDGFLVDRGFQVLLTAYPEAQATFDYAELDLRRFVPGALCRRGDRFTTVADPRRSPLRAVAGLARPAGSAADSVRALRLCRQACRGTLHDLFGRPESTTAERLQELGFSAAAQQAFLRPFLSGVFLDRELETSSRLLEFVMRMFATGDTAVPARGMGALGEQLAARLPAGSIRLATPVAAVGPTAVELAGGGRLEAAAVVVATTGLVPEVEPRAWRSVTNFTFDAPETPVHGPILVLDGTRRGPVGTFHVASEVAGGVAPPGRALVSASVVGLVGAAAEPDVRRQLAGWFGSAVADWRLVQALGIERALPVVPPRLRTPRLDSGVFVCGDHVMAPTLNAALATGRRAAAAVAAALAR